MMPFVLCYSASAVAWLASTAFVHYAVLRRRHRAFLPICLAVGFFPLK